MTLEKEILEEFIEKEKKEWISDNSLLFNKEELERLIQLTQSKIIQRIEDIIKDKIKTYENCKSFAHVHEDSLYELNSMLRELQSLKKSLLENEKDG